MIEFSISEKLSFLSSDRNFPFLREKLRSYAIAFEMFRRVKFVDRDKYQEITETVTLNRFSFDVKSHFSRSKYRNSYLPLELNLMNTFRVVGEQIFLVETFSNVTSALD